MGGRSSEHSISCISGRSIVQALDPQRYDIQVIGIRRDGVWVRSSTGGLDVLSQEDQLPEVSSEADVVSIEVALDVDVAFPVLHGPWGEDGSIQGVMETLQVPFVGSGVLSSAVAMDKGFMKTLLASAGLEVGRYVAISDRRWMADRAAVLGEVAALGLPVFVKPARAGSSLGISKVSREDELIPAIDQAREHDPRIIIEASVEQAREIECAVLVDDHGHPRASRCAEIVVREGHDFYDFEAKYLDDSADLLVPADLPAAIEQQVQQVALAAFEALACEGLARVDFFVGPEGEVVLNEVNTMPGFTSISLFPRMWTSSGLDYAALVDRLVQDALRKGTDLR
ncbi:MAG TPA: D-alanine--D-alanine ligase A [Actinobacteria bacterium]|jgi:D-alanine-D-alanine ligase|nr:D-alanine--D-alanine ligase A [Actinomycetota bacterium]